MSHSQPSDLPRWMHPRSAYIHVPFCAHHCWYCDFAVVAGQDSLTDRYLDALELEISGLCEPQRVETIFIGGGTPTQLTPFQLTRLFQIVRKWLIGVKTTGDDPLTGFEFSVEVNPETLDQEKTAILAAHGVNRISIGAQSFHPALLRFLERNHSPEDIVRSVESARTLFPRSSLDLIFGMPGQNLQQWEADLRKAIALEVGHISTYGLTYEKGTRLWKARQSGSVMALDEEGERSMYERAMQVLEQAGFEHYEISNFALPGQRCRHNETYWANEAYFGFGVGAARYINGRRETNTRSTTEYIRKVLAGASAVQDSEQLSPEERARETAAVQIRRMQGILIDSFFQQTGFDVHVLAGAAIERMMAQGLLESNGKRVYLTRTGKCLADLVCQHLLSSPE